MLDLLKFLGTLGGIALLIWIVGTGGAVWFAVGLVVAAAIGMFIGSLL